MLMLHFGPSRGLVTVEDWQPSEEHLPYSTDMLFRGHGENVNGDG